MFTKHLSLAVGFLIIVIICIGSSMASNQAWFSGASASEVRINFDQVFADAVWHGDVESPMVGDAYVNRDTKSDRLPIRNSALLETIALPHCEPIAAPFADPVLGRIVGRCAA